MTIINIRGTSGAGKSTLVRAIMTLYNTKEENNIQGRMRPISYTLRHPNRAPLEVIGHYETACGGCDTIKTLDDIYTLVEAAHNKGHHVLFEGMLLCSDVKRSIELSKRVKSFVAISLTTPVEQCLDNIRQRRAEKGNTKDLAEKNTRTRHEYEKKQVGKLKDAGVNVFSMNYTPAFERVKEELGCI